MAKQTKLAVNLAQDFTDQEKEQGRENLGLHSVAASGDYDDLDNRPQLSEITTTMHGPDEDYTTHVKHLDIDLDNYALTVDSDSIGYYVPEIPPHEEERALMVDAGNMIPYWGALPKGVFVAYWSGYATGHGNTTFAEITAAHDSGQLVIVRNTILGGDVIRVLATIDENKAVFTRTSGVLSNGNYGNVANGVLVVWANDTYEAHTSNLSYSAGQGIEINSNVISSKIYVAEIITDSDGDYCNFEGIRQADLQGKLVLIKRQDNGSFAGKLKYVQNDLALFDNFFAQPMRMSEIFVHSDNTVTTQTIYVPDSTLVGTYRATRFGTTYWQANSNNMNFRPSYMTTASDVTWYSGESGTTTIPLSDVIAAIAHTNTYQYLKVSVTGSICHARDNEPSGTPQGFIRARFQVGRNNASLGTYEYVEVAESPYAHVDCDNYTHDGNFWQSNWHDFSLDMTIDRNRLETLGFSSSYSDPSISVGYELVNEAPGGTIHDLGVRNMTMKFTLLTHL